MLTAPGIPMLFQGQEFLRDGWFDDGRPIDWSRREQYASVVRMYHDLIQLRCNRQGVTAGLCGQHTHVYHLNEEQKILAMHRWKEGGPGDDVVIVFKFSEGACSQYRLGFPRPGQWWLRFNGDARVYGEQFDGTQVDHLTVDEVTADDLPYSASIDIGAYSSLIFSQAL